jgi:uncharacterized protein YfaS (alpha-2-macroglobulin family)
MKKGLLFVLLVSVAVLPLAIGAATPRDQQWKSVDEAVQQGLPKTAIERLDPIIDGAMKDKAYPEAIKAIARKIALEGTIQGNKPEERITRMQAEIAKAPKEMVPAMDAILAEWFWQYFQQNRGRFLQRTTTAQSPGEDFTTWDLPRIFAEIDKQFTKALSAEAELKKIKVSDFDDLLTKGAMPDKYRPTLYDFLVFEALAFYTSAEQAGAKAEDTFEMAPDSPIFAPVEEFLKWEPKTTDTESRTLKAIKLYQNLLRFHEKDEDKTAYLHDDLERLIFGQNRAFGEDKNKRFKEAMKRFIDRWGDHEVSAIARYRWAVVLQQENDLVEAHRLAKQGAEAFVATVGGAMCYNLQQQIESKTSQVSTERVWNEPWPTIDVRYRNVTQVYFRLIKEDWLGLVKENGSPESLDEQGRKALLSHKPDQAWSAKLPATEDYRERIEKLEAPKDIIKELKPGFYYIISSHDEGFTDKDNVVSYTTFWVSNLSLVMRTQQTASNIEGFVLDAISGEPIEGAEVQVLTQSTVARGGTTTGRGGAPVGGGMRSVFVPGNKTKTDGNGFYSLPQASNTSYLLYITYKDQQLSTANQHSVYASTYRNQPRSQTVFFTDRSLYRPGQTIQYKGICLNVDQEGDNYKTLPNQVVTVVFRDSNGKDIAQQKHQTNDYGSFNGSFTAPRDRVMGRMTISVTGANQPSGSASVNVEEYKRPKFQTTLEPPKTAIKLNEKVTVEGKAIAYTGAAIDGAKVRWRVVRQVRYPIWWGWRNWWLSPVSDSQEIAHGTATTETNGTFTIEFIAKPDLSVQEKDEPTFQFTIYADVTDTTGETRSGQRVVNVGYTDLKATMSAEAWLTDEKPVEVNILTQTLNNEGQKADVSVKIHSLKQPEKVRRANLSNYRPMPLARGADGKIPPPKPDPSNPNSWELGEVKVEQGLTTDGAGKGVVRAKLGPGAYRAILQTQDRFGKKVTAELPLEVLKPEAKQFPIKVPYKVEGPKWSVEPGEEFMALWGTGYEKARAYVQIEHRRKIIKSFWTELGATQQPVKQKVTEDMRGGFYVHVTMVRENRAYFTSRKVDVPWTNKKLTVAWEHFLSKLEPGQKETWTAVVTGPDAKKAVAEMVAALYDESLDAYLPHNWMKGFNVFRQDSSALRHEFENMLRTLGRLQGNWTVPRKDANMTFRSFPADIVANVWRPQVLLRAGARGGGGGFAAESAVGGMGGGGRGSAAAPGIAMDFADDTVMRQSAMAPAELSSAGGGFAGKKADSAASGAGQPEGPAPDLSKVSARSNLNETAFFFPRLISSSEGEVRMEFTMPEALTKWKFMGFAHDNQLRSGYLQDDAVTAKDLMVQPNAPRFLREGDVLEFTVKVSNQSATRQSGSVRLSLADARTEKSVDASLGLSGGDQKFDIPSKESRTFSWRLTVPDGLGPISYKAVGSTGRISDGEEGLIPVLSRRILVTESLPLPIRDAGTKKFKFDKLLDAAKSNTLQSQSLTVQMVSNPSWYAVMALPYLMERPFECSEVVFNRLYANSLARHIAGSDPKIKKVFEQWKGTEALDSPLEKNQDLKAVLIEETPWVRQAEAESKARRNVGILFDENRLNDETAATLKKLSDMQLPDGAWTWFPGCPPDHFITLYITTGFGRMRHLGVKIDTAMAVRSLAYLDGWINDIYREILKLEKEGKTNKDDNHLSSLIAYYLYGRSFFLEDKPIAAENKEAVEYFLGQAGKYWLQLAFRQSQGHLALALKRFGNKAKAQDIMRSIKERSVSNEEMGTFWRDTELSWWWYRAPIETQSLMIEAFDEIMDDQKAVEECKVWLLKQKQTQDWKTTKATADAVYALLLRGDNLLASTALVEMTLDNTTIKPEKIEAGTGFYEQRFVRGEIKPEMGNVTLKKEDKGVAWGSIHWQYLEDMSKVTPYEGTPLKLEKSLYTRQFTKQGRVLEPVKGPVKVGDELVVRIVLRTDRDMEYVHLKDYRGSGTEPVNVISRYKMQDGLGYYESTRDTASHFFISYLPKGTYVFEYATRVVHKGKYQTGVASIQCMYAPEFNSHSESLPLEVQ